MFIMCCIIIISSSQVKDFTLENPSSLPLLVQVVPLSLYPNPINIINVLKEKYGADFSDPNIINDSGAFSLEDLEENNVRINISFCFLCWISFFYGF